MSEDQLKALLDKIKSDPAFREQLRGARDLDSLMENARQAGFDIAKEDLVKYQSEGNPADLSDSELESVSGGMLTPDSWALEPDWACIQELSPPQDPLKSHHYGEYTSPKQGC